jgi:hypothetical protein
VRTRRLVLTLVVPALTLAVGVTTADEQKLEQELLAG